MDRNEIPARTVGIAAGGAGGQGGNCEGIMYAGEENCNGGAGGRVDRAGTGRVASEGKCKPKKGYEIITRRRLQWKS